MSASRRRYGRLRKALIILVVAELAYLFVFNALLRLPLTQDVVNMIRPEKFSASWEGAWTWYPFRVHATGLSVNGQSRSQQWQLEAGQASASIAMLPLVLKTSCLLSQSRFWGVLKVKLVSVIICYQCLNKPTQG